MRSTNPLTLKRHERCLAGISAVVLRNLSLFLLLLCAVSIPSCYGLTARQEQAREPLGALTSVGEVYLNDAPASGESTVFSGDKIRTGQTGVATFAMSGKGTLKISPQSQVVFSGDYRFAAELVGGTVVLDTIRGNGLTLRIGNFVVVASFRQQSSISKITRSPDGSFQVTCLDGGLGVLTLEAKSGQFLMAGQSLSASAGSGSLQLPPPPKTVGNFHTGWLLLGLAGAGAAAGTAALGHSGGRQSISPSTP